MRKLLDKLADIVHNADDVPDDVVGAINDVLADAGDPVPWYQAPFCKNGRFSKTATFATVVNVLVIASYVLGWSKGTELGPWTVPAFDVTASAAIMALANGTYVANRLASGRENGNGQ